MSAELPTWASRALLINSVFETAGPLSAFLGPHSLIWTSLFGEASASVAAKFWCGSAFALGIMCHVSRTLSEKVKIPLVAVPALITMVFYHIFLLLISIHTLMQDKTIFSTIATMNNFAGVLEGDLSGVEHALPGLGVVATVITHFSLLLLTLFGLKAALHAKLTRPVPAAKKNM